MRTENGEFFNPNISFLKLPIVWITITVILTFAAVIFFAIYDSSNYIPCRTASCYNSFINDFKFPLGITTLLIPILAIYAAQHRSEISIAQINSSESQNIFANYYKHLEEFKILLNDQNLMIEITNYRQLHLKLFPDVKAGNYEIPFNVRNFLVSELVVVYHELKAIEELSENLLSSNEKVTTRKVKILHAFNSAYSPLKKLKKYFQFEPTDLDKITEMDLCKSIEEIQIYDYTSQINQTVTKLIEVSKFCGEFQIPSIMLVLAELEADEGVIHGIPTDRLIKFNLPKIIVDVERRRVSR